MSRGLALHWHEREESNRERINEFKGENHGEDERTVKDGGKNMPGKALRTINKTYSRP